MSRERNSVQSSDKIYFALNESLSEAASASMILSNIAPISIKPLVPGGEIDTTIHLGALPGVRIWVTDVRKTTTVRVRTKENRQIFYFPGRGEVIVETKRGIFIADQEYGVSTESAAILEVRILAGRSGVGLAIEHAELTKRLHNILGRPVTRRIDFADRFHTRIQHRSAVEELVRSLTSPAAAGALASCPIAAAGLAAALIDLGRGLISSQPDAD